MQNPNVLTIQNINDWQFWSNFCQHEVTKHKISHAQLIYTRHCTNQDHPDGDDSQINRHIILLTKNPPKISRIFEYMRKLH